MPLKLKRRHGSPCWYIRGTVRGVSVDESTGLSDRQAAEDVLALRSAEIVTEAVHGSKAVRTFAQAALSYMEAGGEAKHLAPILAHFGTKKLAQIGQDEIDKCADKVMRGRSGSTKNRKVYTPISAVLHHAAGKGWCGRPLIARPKQPEGRVRWITYPEAERLLAAAAPHLRLLVLFLLCTGARVSEALYLDWRDVDLDRAHVSFIDTKNGEARGVPLHARILAELRKINRREGPVFLTDEGEPYADRNGEGGGQVSTAWGSMLKRAGITDFTPHDCRHTWATWHYAANKDLLVLMALGGWKSEKMVLRYAHVNTAHLAPSIGLLWPETGENPGTDADQGPHALTA